MEFYMSEPMVCFGVEAQNNILNLVADVAACLHGQYRNHHPEIKLIMTKMQKKTMRDRYIPGYE